MSVNPLNLSPQAFAVFALCAHVLVWTGIRLLGEHTLHDDAIQLYVDSFTFAWGYNNSSSHPPLLAWLYQLWHMVVPPSNASTYLLSQITIVIAMIALWQLGRHILKNTAQLCLALIMMEGILYHSYLTPKFNHNTILIALWALAILAFYQALHRNSWMTWLLCAVSIVAAVLAKYTSFLLVLAMLIYVMICPAYRYHLSNGKCYAAALFAFVLFLPHIDWLITTHFSTIHYVLARTETASPLLSQLRFALAPFANMLPLVLFWLAAGRPRPLESLKQAFRLSTLTHNTDRLFLLVITITPFIAMLIPAILFGWRMRSQWATPFLITVPILLVELFRPKLSPVLWRNIKRSWLILLFTVAGFHYGEFFLKPSFRDHLHSQQSPLKNIAKELNADWRHLSADIPLPYVVSDLLSGGIVAFYAPDHPQPLPLPLTATEKKSFASKGGLILTTTDILPFADHPCRTEKRSITRQALWGSTKDDRFSYAFLQPESLCQPE